MAIGFEFEIGDTIVSSKSFSSKEDTLWYSWFLPPPTSQNIQEIPLKKGMDFVSIEQKQDFRVTIDELTQAGNNHFDLEFYIRHLDDGDTKNRDLMSHVLKDVSTFIQNLDQRLKKETRVYATSLDKNAHPSLCVEGRCPYGQWQATAGLSLDALYAVRSGRALQIFYESFEPKWEALQREKNKNGEAIEALQNALASLGSADDGAAGRQTAEIWSTIETTVKQQINTIAIDPQQQDIRHLTAIIDLLITIPLTVYTGASAPYPKAFSGSLLARTDFASILSLLPPSQQKAISTHDTAWVNLLLTCINTVLSTPGQVQANDPIFLEESFRGGLTLGEWYSNLAKLDGRKDLLTVENYPSIANSNGRDKDKIAAQAKTLESLGSMGSQTDPPQLKGRLQRPIFEFRKLGMVAPETMVDAGTTFWDYIELAHRFVPVFTV